MKVSVVLLVTVFVVGQVYCEGAGAQGIPPGASGVNPETTESGTQIDNLNKLKLNAWDIHRELNDLRATKQATKYIRESGLSCELAQAAKAGDGSTHMNGRTVNINAYEVTCRSGVGYMLISENHAKPVAISCFSIAGASDAGEGGNQSNRSTPMACLLPDNKDVNAQAERLLKGLSANCTVSGVASFGVNANNHTEYVEVACSSKVGYVLVIPQQRNTKTQISVMSCQDAARHGLRCHLTDTNGNASAPITMQTLRDSLEQNGIHCTAPKLRLIGREREKKRYVVEAQCPEYPDGLIAYIPVNDNTQKFETITCAAAPERNLSCQLGTTQ